MNINCYEAICLACGSKTDIPVLGDFSYGEFIARGVEGRACAYLNALEEPAWKTIEDILSGLYGNDDFGDADRFRHVVGKCLDKIDGEELSIQLGPVCPVCKERKLSYNDLVPVGAMDVQEAAFIEFWAMSEEKRKEMVRGFWAECPPKECPPKTEKNRKWWHIFKQH